METETLTEEQIKGIIDLHSKFESTLKLYSKNLQSLFENRMLYDSTLNQINTMDKKYQSNISLKVSEMKEDKEKNKQLQKTLSASMNNLLNNFTDIASLKGKLQSLNVKLNEAYADIIISELNKK